MNIKFPPEPQKGCIEYKLKLTNLDDIKFNKLTSQMLWRLKEGKGKTIYYLGLSDDGTPTGIDKNTMIESQHNLYSMVISNNCIIYLISVYQGINGEIRKYFIKENNKYIETYYDSDIIN